MDQTPPNFCTWSGPNWTVTFNGKSVVKPPVTIDATGTGAAELDNITKAVEAAKSAKTEYFAYVKQQREAREAKRAAKTKTS